MADRVPDRFVPRAPLDKNRLSRNTRPDAGLAAEPLAGNTERSGLARSARTDIRVQQPRTPAHLRAHVSASEPPRPADIDHGSSRRAAMARAGDVAGDTPRRPTGHAPDNRARRIPHEASRMALGPGGGPALPAAVARLRAQHRRVCRGSGGCKDRPAGGCSRAAAPPRSVPGMRILKGVVGGRGGVPRVRETRGRRSSEAADRLIGFTAPCLSAG